MRISTELRFTRAVMFVPRTGTRCLLAHNWSWQWANFLPFKVICKLEYKSCSSHDFSLERLLYSKFKEQRTDHSNITLEKGTYTPGKWKVCLNCFGKEKFSSDSFEFILFQINKHEMPKYISGYSVCLQSWFFSSKRKKLAFENRATISKSEPILIKAVHEILLYVVTGASHEMYVQNVRTLT